jgi:phage shock protein A
MDLYQVIIIALVQGSMTALLSVITYFQGRKRGNAEVEKIKVEKKSIEAAAGLSTAEAASIIAQAAADVVQPLTNRIRELQQQNLDQQNQISGLARENTDLRNKVTFLETQVALVQKSSALTGEVYPHI